jgi:monoamine oxidase
LVKAARAAVSADHDVSLADAVQASPQWQKADDHLRRRVRDYVNDSIEQEFAGDWNEVSALHVDDEREMAGSDDVFSQGYDQIVRVLAKGLDIRLHRKVIALAPTSRGVKVVLSQGEVEEVDHVVVTVPLGALKAGQIHFGTPLAPVRQAAIDALGMGLLNKCFLKFDKVAWPSDIDNIAWLGPQPGEWSQWMSLARAEHRPILIAFHGGSQARALEKLDDRATLDGAMQALRSMFGSDFKPPVAMQVTRWSQDELTLGSYSFHTVGTSSETRKALAGTDWDGRLVFAGEATSPDTFATAHGAYLSGQVAAAALTV